MTSAKQGGNPFVGQVIGEDAKKSDIGIKLLP